LRVSPERHQAPGSQHEDPAGEEGHVDRALVEHVEAPARLAVERQSSQAAVNLENIEPIANERGQGSPRSEPRAELPGRPINEDELVVLSARDERIGADREHADDVVDDGGPSVNVDDCEAALLEAEDEPAFVRSAPIC